MTRRLLLGVLLGASVSGAGAQGTPHPPTIFLVGELPAAAVQPLIDPAKARLMSSSAAGMTTRQYVRSGEWQQVLGQIKPGDIVVLDFDADANPLASPGLAAEGLSAKSRADAARTIAGYGDGTFDYLDPGTHRLELVHSYGWYLREMVVDTVNHGGNPILCAGPADAAHPGAADWARYIATEQRIPLIAVGADGNFSAALAGTKPDPLLPYLKSADR